MNFKEFVGQKDSFLRQDADHEISELGNNFGNLLLILENLNIKSHAGFLNNLVENLKINFSKKKREKGYSQREKMPKFVLFQ